MPEKGQQLQLRRQILFKKTKNRGWYFLVHMRVHCQDCFTLARPTSCYWGSLTSYSGTTSKVTELNESVEGTVRNADRGVAPECQASRSGQALTDVEF
ncbi:hypothetical protein AOLI_G00048630 [Acnodon oligacanthus]